MSILPTHIDVHHMCVWCQPSQNWASDPLELEFQVVVNHYVRDGN